MAAINFMPSVVGWFVAIVKSWDLRFVLSGSKCQLSAVLKDDLRIITPPRLLTGVALLYWGSVAGVPVVALVLAFLLEGRQWVRLRWNFGELGHVKAFQLSLLFILVGMVFMWMGEERATAIRLVQWSPLYFLPVEFAQRYGTQDRMNLNTFFYFSRKRMVQDRREGRDFEPIQINTGYAYLGMVLFAAASYETSLWVEWVGISLLAIAAVVAVVKARGLSMKGFLLMLPVALAAAFFLQGGMLMVYEWYKDGMPSSSKNSQGNGFTSDKYSRLGELGNIKLDPEIQWRLWGDVDSPTYLRMVTFNAYNQGNWVYRYSHAGYESHEDTYEREGTTLLGERPNQMEVFRSDDEERAKQKLAGHAFQLRGTVDDNSPKCIVPTLPGYYAVDRLLGSQTRAETNPMGNLRFINREAVLDYQLWSELNAVVQDAAPEPKIDLAIPEAEREVIAQIARELKLAEMATDAQRVEAIRSYFQREFEYGTHFEIKKKQVDISSVAWFLTTLKRGHCEYFATATALLLRHAGVPTRYAVGYGVMERDEEVWVVRGTHAHAWCRSYVDGKWVDVDLTPPDWRTRDGAMHTDRNIFQRSIEWIKLVREDFQVWRQGSDTKTTFWWVIGSIAGLLVLYIVSRLWTSRLRGEAGGLMAIGWDGEVPLTPVHQLEKLASQQLGPRPEWMPYGRWLLGLAELEKVDAQLVERLVDAHQMARYDQAPEALIAQMKREVRELRQQLRAKS